MQVSILQLFHYRSGHNQQRWFALCTLALCTLALCTLALCTLFVLLPRLAYAHGGGTPRLTDAMAGPYRLFVWTQPEPLRAGEVHVTIGITLADQPATDSATVVGAQPVTDATVTVRFVAVDGSTEALVRDAILGGVGAVYYEADASLPTAGAWRFMIEVSGNAGDGAAEFTAELLAARTVNWRLIAGGGVLFVLLIALLGVWNRRQRRTIAR